MKFITPKTNVIALTFLLFLSASLFGQRENTNIKIFMIGNSTMADKPYKKGNPEKGWGQVFPLYFKEEVSIENYAVNGRSTKSFIDEGKWEKVKNRLRKGNYLIIEFGHNDSKKEDPKRFADAETDYKKNLEMFITEARKAGAVPVLATPINRRKFDSTGMFVDTHGKYPVVVRAVAASMNVPLLDLHKKSEVLLKRYGPDDSKRLYLWITPSEYDSLPNGRQDDTHFSAYGAFRMCDLAIEELRTALPELVKYLKD